MISLLCLLASIVLFVCAALGAGPWDLGSATIYLEPLGLAFLAASFLPWASWRGAP